MRFLLLLLLLTACTGERIDQSPQPGSTIQLPPMEWRVVSEDELRRVYVEAGMPLTDGQKLHGFAGMQGGKTVIYTMPPRRVDDQATLTLGHEVLHVAIGDYHR